MQINNISDNLIPSGSPFVSADTILYNSVLDNIGTFRHFEPKTKGTSRHAKDFYLLYYRRKNLSLKSKLEQSSYRYNQTIQATCKALACCSSTSLVEQTSSGTHHITHTSAKCKSKYCLICSRIAANRHVQKFIAKTKDQEHASWFAERNFYFFTATLKHDSETRTDNYLQELKGYVTKLQRSKLWRDSFIKSKDKSNYGGINSIELTIGKNGYHIHLHSLICCKKLTEKVNEIQSKLQKLWFSITGDSHQVRLDLLNLSKMNTVNHEGDFESCPDLSIVSEVFKYAIKSESVSSLKSDDIDQFCQWIIETKGKNFINAFGYFRKLGLINRKSENKLDQSIDLEETPSETLLTKTINIQPNFTLNFNYSTNVRRQIIKYSNLVGLTDTFFIFTHLRELAINILKIPLNDETMINVILDELSQYNRSNQMFDDMTHLGNKLSSWSMNTKVDDDGFLLAI